ncbi:MAG TPA: rRNA maturation RNase YbeY [Bacteroidales bacterium]|nr:rRNA maturation RNase YbeY [Bacteroidales bacterium]
MSIKIYYDNIKYRIHKTAEIKKFLEKVITDENKKPGDLVFILTGDKSLLKINRQFLNHDYFTDVISFDYSEEVTVNGEIYISIDTIRRNAGRYKTEIEKELLRVMIHGVLHLCGYRDDSSKERRKMFRRQEMRLKEFEV